MEPAVDANNLNDNLIKPVTSRDASKLMCGSTALDLPGFKDHVEVQTKSAGAVVNTKLLCKYQGLNTISNRTII